MLRERFIMNRTIIGAAAFASLALVSGLAQALTPFQTDVATAIDRGLSWLASNGAYSDPPTGSSTYPTEDSVALPMLALLEKRASGNPSDPPSGYSGASTADQQRLRNVAKYIINLTNANGAGFYAYRDGARMMALSGYALTGGPDQGVLGTAITVKAAMDLLVNRALAAQNGAGYFCYNNGGCNDSSTTQLTSAGLFAAKAYYENLYPGDAHIGTIATALGNARQAYVNNGGQGSDNSSCYALSSSERGHGYHPPNEGYRPSLQQTAAGVYIQLFGGADVNTPNVQAYMEWIKNHYRYSDLDNLRNSWPEAWDYYMWSSFKGTELIRRMGIAPTGTNLGPDSYGTLPAASAPACDVREVHLDPAVVTRPGSLGAGGVGYYSNGGLEQKSQYFDYAHTLLRFQCAGGSAGFFGCNGSPGYWNNYARQAYALLVLQRATGNIVQACDIDHDQDVDTNDLSAIRAGIGQTPNPGGDPRDANGDGKITMNDVRYCTLKCTRASCATQ